MPKDPTKEMPSICAWCKKMKHGIFDESATVNYGICQECLKTVMQNEDKHKE